MFATRESSVIILLVLLLGASQCLAQPPSSCTIGQGVEDPALLDSELRNNIIPKLQFLQQILDANFSDPPPAPKVSVALNTTQDSVIFSLELDSWATEFRISYYAETSLSAPTPNTTILPATSGDAFSYRATLLLSGSNFARNSRYFYSAISSRSRLNQQSRPSQEKYFDYLPQFAVDAFVGTIPSDKTPMLLDITLRHFEPSLVITLIAPDGSMMNLTYTTAPGTTGTLSTVSIARAAIPSLPSGGTYTLRFSVIQRGQVVSKPLTVLAPFRPRFEGVLPSTLPLAGGTIRVLLSNVIYPLDLASTVIVYGSGAIISKASLVEISQSGTQDFFVTFDLKSPISASSSLNYTLIPNGEPKAFVQFSITFSAVRLLSIGPTFFTNRPSNVKVTISVDSGTPASIDLVLRRGSNLESLIVISNPLQSGVLMSPLSFAPVASGVFVVSLNFAAGRDVGLYTATLTVFFGTLPNATIVAPFEVRNPIPPSMSLSPSEIFDDTENSVLVGVANIGDIVSSSNLIVTCGTSATCKCSVLQFSISFASLSCLIRGASGTTSIKINNTNFAGFGDHITKSLLISRATSPRFVAASSTVFTTLGRFPLAFSVANFNSVDEIKVAGVSVFKSSFTSLRVVQPFDSGKLATLQNEVKNMYASEAAFLSAFDSVAVSFTSTFAFNATICLIRMPMIANSSATEALVEIFQTFPIAQVSFQVSYVPVLNAPIVRLSVSQISLSGGTPVTVNIGNFIPVTQISDIDIVFLTPSANGTSEVSVSPSLKQVSSTEASFSFVSPVLPSLSDVQFKIMSRIDSLLGRSNASSATKAVLFALPVFDPRRFVVQSFSQKTLYSIGGPRIITFFVNFLKALPVSVTVNSLDCTVISSPSDTEIKLQPSKLFSVTVSIKNFDSKVIGDVLVSIISGNEQANAVLAVIPPPTAPVVVSQEGTNRIPSTTSRRVTVSFQHFIASANSSSFVVLLSNGVSISLSSADVASDFTLTTVSFIAPPIGALTPAEPSRTIFGRVVDLSSACNIDCSGNFTLEYFNADLPIFVVMSPTRGPPSRINSIVLLINNVQTSNLSLLYVEVSSVSQKNNVSVSVQEASFAGPGLSAQSVITIQISWTSFPRPAESPVSVNITLRMGSQTLDIPTPYVFLPDNRPQLLSLSPKIVSIDGGLHSCAFIQPQAYGFISAKVFIDNFEVTSTIIRNGSAITFVSPRVSAVGTYLVNFVFQGIVPVNLSDTIEYITPPPVTVTSVFPPEFSSLGSTVQATLGNVPRFWTVTSLRASLVSGANIVRCQVVSFDLSVSIATISCPALDVGFYGLEIVDVSASTRIARSSAIPVSDPLVPKFRSHLPSTIFLTEKTLMSIVFEQYPVGSTPSLFFKSSTSEIPVEILSVVLEPSTTSSTVCTLIVYSIVSMPSFSIRLSVKTSAGATLSTVSPVIDVIDDSKAVVVEVVPPSINSVGGIVDVSLRGYPPGVPSSSISATFTVNGVPTTATVLLFTYFDSSGQATLRLQFPSINTATSSNYDVTIKPKGLESKIVSFSLSVIKVSPAVLSVFPSSVLDSGNQILQIRLVYFPVITSSGQLSVSIDGFSGFLPVSLKSSTADLTVFSVTTTPVSIQSSGNFSLRVNSILSPSDSASSILSIQVSEKVLFVSEPRQSVNSGARAFITFTFFLPAIEYQKFNEFTPGRSYVQDKRNVIVQLPHGSKGSLGQNASGVNIIYVVRKDAPYQGCITFGVLFTSTIDSSGLQPLNIYYTNNPPATPITSTVEVDILARFLSLSPSSGASSGGYAVVITVRGLQSFSNASVFFGDSLAVVVSHDMASSSGSVPITAVTVRSPRFSFVSDVDVTVRVNGNEFVSSKFSVTLGCTDYTSFCRSLPGRYIANTPLISSNPPSDATCTESYCAALSSIPIPVLSKFPEKQSTLIPTISFTVEKLFGTSISHIIVQFGSETLASVQSAVYSTDSRSFAVTVKSPDVNTFSTYPIVVYSALVGKDRNASFLFTSVPPIKGNIKVASVSSTSIPFETASDISVSLTNFPFTIGTPTVNFVIDASAALLPLGPRAISALLISSSDFGNATVQVTFRPFLVLSGNVNVSLSIRGVSNLPSESASVTILVRSRVPRNFTVSALNPINSTAFRSVPGAMISLAMQGFSGPNVTVCFGFSDPVSKARYQPNCALDCVVSIDAIRSGSLDSVISIPYRRDFLNASTHFNFAPRYGDLNVDIYDGIIPLVAGDCSAAGTPLVSRLAVLTFHEQNVPTLSGNEGTDSFPALVPFAQFSRITINESVPFERHFSFSNFYNPGSDSISALIGATNSNGFPVVDAACTFRNCRIKVSIGGKVSDASLVGQGVDIIFTSTNAQRTSRIIVKTKFITPDPIVVPARVPSSGGAMVTVTSYAFSLLPNSTRYSLNNSDVSLISVYKIGSIGTAFVIKISETVALSELPVMISCSTCVNNTFSDTFKLDVLICPSVDATQLRPSVDATQLILNPELVSLCQSGERNVQLSLTNLSTPLGSANSFFVMLNNVARRYEIVSGSVFRFFFSCRDNFANPDQVPLEVRISISGATCPVRANIKVPALPINMVVQGASVFRLEEMSTVVIFADTLLETGKFEFHMVASYKQDDTLSLDTLQTVNLIRSDRVKSTFSVTLKPTFALTPPGLYTFVLHLPATLQSAKASVSIIDPTLAAVCDMSSGTPSIVLPGSITPVCAFSAIAGGLVPIRITSNGGYSLFPEEIVLVATRADGSSFTGLAPSLRNFVDMKSAFNVSFNPYKRISGESTLTGVLIAQLSISSSIIPQARFLVTVAIQLDPQMSDVAFSGNDETLSSLSVQFDQFIAFSNIMDCSKIFKQETVSLLGVGARCIFQPQAISVLLGNAATISASTPNNVVSLLANVVSPASGFPLFNTEHSKTVRPVRADFAIPVASVSGTESVEGCPSAPPARLVAMLSSPRKFQSLSWNCINCKSGSLPSILQTLGNQPRISIQAEDIKKGQCDENTGCGFIAIFEDFLSSPTLPRFIKSAIHYVRSNPLPAPEFQILGLNERITPSNSLSLRTRFDFSACQSDSGIGRTSYTWTLDGPSKISTASITGPFFNIRPDTLSPGSYTVSATVFFDDLQTQDKMKFDVSPRRIFGQISAPSVVSASKNFTLDARLSRDEETTIQPPLPLVFKWSCFDQDNFPCVDITNSPLILPQGSVVTIIGNTLPASAVVTLRYSFTLLITNAFDSRVSDLLQHNISVTADVVPSISVAYPTLRVNEGSILPIVLDAILEDPALNVTWSETSGLLQNFTSIIDPAFTNRQKRIIISAFSLVGGQVYTFSATVDSDRRAVASVTINVNAPPRSGKCEVVSPSSGCGVNDMCNVRTSVTVSCSNWVDLDLPLRYEYGYVESSGVQNRFDYVTDTSQTFSLPIGNYTLFVNICDGFFTCAQVSRVNQIPLTISSTRIDAAGEAALLSDISKYARSANVEQFAPLLTSAISYFAPVTGGRRLLANEFVEKAVDQIILVTGTLSSEDSVAAAGACGSLIRTTSQLVSKSAISNSMVTNLLPAMITLSGSFLGGNIESVEKNVADSKEIVNVISSVTGLDKIDGSNLIRNFEMLRKLENNMLSAALLLKEKGQKPVDIASLDGTYIAKAVKSALQDSGIQAISMQSPELPKSSAAKFDLSFNADKTSSVTLRTSVQTKSKWEKLPQSGTLMSDLHDCTAFKDGVPLGQKDKSGFKAKIVLEFPLKSGTGAGSLAALQRDPSSFKFQFFDDQTGQLSGKDCTGSFLEVAQNPLIAQFVGDCSHLTMFGVVAVDPKAAPAPAPVPVPIPAPVPMPAPAPLPPPSRPPIAPSPPSSPDESSSSFPVWASVVIAVGGAAVVALAGHFIKKRRDEAANTRAKQIVAASLWKQMIKPMESPKPALSRFSPPSSVSPGMALTGETPATTHRQLLADLAAAIDREEAADIRRQRLADIADDDAESVAASTSNVFSSRPNSPVDIRHSDKDALEAMSSFQYPSVSKFDTTPGRYAVESRALPRSKSPFNPASTDLAQIYSSITPSRDDPVASNLRSTGGKSFRQYLANLAASSAVEDALDEDAYLKIPVPSSSSANVPSLEHRHLSSFDGRTVVSDLKQINPRSPGVAPSSRQRLAELAAAGFAPDDVQRDPSPSATIGESASRKLPRSRSLSSRRVFDDANESERGAAVNRNFSDTSNWTSPPINRMVSPHNIRLETPPAQRLSSRLEQSQSPGSGVSLQSGASGAALPPRSRTPSSLSSRDPSFSWQARPGGGSRFEQA